jgi:hypothetical protein
VAKQAGGGELQDSCAADNSGLGLPLFLPAGLAS